MDKKNHNPFIIQRLEIKSDQCGSMTELIRQDWFTTVPYDKPYPVGVIPPFEIQQAMLSVCQPGVVKAWHSHARGQNDALVVLAGKIRLVVQHDKNQFSVVHTGPDSDGPTCMIQYPGNLWHGIQVISNTDAHILYFVNRLYDYAHPDEDRLPPDHKFEGKGFQW